MLGVYNLKNYNKTKLKNLIIDNPDIEIIPLVDEDLYHPDYGYSIGGLGSVWVDEYYCHDDKFYIKTRDCEDLQHSIEEEIYLDRYPNMDVLSDEEARVIEIETESLVTTLPWTKAIFMFIS